MATYVTPGVYYERADSGAPTIAPLRTDIAGFVGIARRGPLGLARPVDSWRQFVGVYGDVTGAGYLAYAVRAFFENGGRRCWVVRVASPSAAPARVGMEAALPAPLPAPAAVPAWDVEAASPGVWGNDLEVEWHETHRAQTAAHPTQSDPDFVTVDSVAGFEAGTHVRAAVGPWGPAYRVVAAVDADRKRLYWVHPRRRPHSLLEQPLTAYDPARPLLIESVEYSLLVRELGRLVTVVDGLSLSPEHRRYGPAVLAPLAVAAPAPVVIVERRTPGTGGTLQAMWPLAAASLPRRPLGGGLDGLAPLTVRDFLGEPGSIADGEDAQRRKRRGLRALETVGEVALVAVPDIHIQPVAVPARDPRPCAPDPCLPPPPLPPATPREPSVGDLPPRFTLEQVFQVQQALVEHCTALGDRFALLDPPLEAVRDARLGVGPLRAWRARFDSDRAALYGPWVLAPDPLRLEPGRGLRAVPPSGHVAGFIARTDLAQGVHRAPANGELAWAQGVTLPIDDALHGVLNPEHVNAIRAFSGRGLRIFGARTLSSNPDWRFVSVRRLVLMLEKAIRVATQWAVFEPNDRATRLKLHLALTSLLLEVWRRGALAGRTAAEAFYVECGPTQNPEGVRARGQMVAEVGVAPAKPSEFVVIRVGRSDNTLETAETLETAS